MKGEVQMGKEQHLNPILSTPRKRYQEPKKRKIRSDKLHDIKIPITESVDLALRRESYRDWGGSKTALGTELLLFGLKEIVVYPEVSYKDKPFSVHCKVDQETYEEIGMWAAKWRVSARRAAHRIFCEAFKKKQLGGVTDEAIQ